MPLACKVPQQVQGAGVGPRAALPAPARPPPPPTCEDLGAEGGACDVEQVFPEAHRIGCIVKGNGLQTLAGCLGCLAEAWKGGGEGRQRSA
jgi:hypothetical protein